MKKSIDKEEKIWYIIVAFEREGEKNNILIKNVKKNKILQKKIDLVKVI